MGKALNTAVGKMCSQRLALGIDFEALGVAQRVGGAKQIAQRVVAEDRGVAGAISPGQQLACRIPDQSIDAATCITDTGLL